MTISLADVHGGYQGIRASTFVDSTLFITTTGNVEGSTGAGIFIQNAQTGGAKIGIAGTVTGGSGLAIDAVLNEGWTIMTDQLIIEGDISGESSVFVEIDYSIPFDGALRGVQATVGVRLTW